MLYNINMPRKKRPTCFRIANFILWAVLWAFFSSGAYATTSSAVKTGFLFNFFKFVQWPETSQQNFQLCIGKGDDLGSSLSAIHGKQVNGVTILLRRNVQGASLKNCNMVFLPAADDRRMQLQQLRGLPILTVGDGEDFINEGGMIGLVEDGSHLGFEVNLQQLRNARLQVSAQLLKLAKNVKGGGG